MKDIQLEPTDECIILQCGEPGVGATGAGRGVPAVGEAAGRKVVQTHGLAHDVFDVNVCNTNTAV